MKDVVRLYALRYGVSDTLHEIATGLHEALDDFSARDYQAEVKKQYRDAATAIFDLRNKFRNLEAKLTEK